MPVKFRRSSLRSRNYRKSNKSRTKSRSYRRRKSRSYRRKTQRRIKRGGADALGAQGGADALGAQAHLGPLPPIPGSAPSLAPKVNASATYARLEDVLTRNRADTGPIDAATIYSTVVDIGKDTYTKLGQETNTKLNKLGQDTDKKLKELSTQLGQYTDTKLTELSDRIGKLEDMVGPKLEECCATGSGSPAASASGEPAAGSGSPAGEPEPGNSGGLSL